MTYSRAGTRWEDRMATNIYDAQGRKLRKCPGMRGSDGCAGADCPVCFGSGIVCSGGMDLLPGVPAFVVQPMAEGFMWMQVELRPRIGL